MATRAVIPVYGPSGRRSIIVSWSGLLNGDDGEDFESNGYRLESTQLLGTLGVGGSLLFEGTNELIPANRFPLTMFGTSGAHAALGIFFPVLMHLAGPPIIRHCRPRVTAGDGTTNLQFILNLSLV